MEKRGDALGILSNFSGPIPPVLKGNMLKRGLYNAISMKPV